MKIRIVFHFLILVFITLLSFNSVADTEVRGATGQPPAPALSGDEQNCVGIERQFQTHVSNVAGAAAQQYQSIYQCLMGSSAAAGDCAETRQQTLDLLDNYLAAQEILYRAATHSRITTLDGQSNGQASPCFLNTSGEVNFEGDDLRVVARQAGRYCENNLWPDEIQTEVSRILEQGSHPGVPSEVFQAVSALHNSPISRLIPLDFRYRTNVTEEEKLRVLRSAFNTLAHNSSRIQSTIDGLQEDHQLYQLYLFNQQFQNFRSELPTDQQSLAERCLASSNFIQDCEISPTDLLNPATSFVLRLAGTSGERCRDRVVSFTAEMLPIIPTIDGLHGLRNARDAYDAGLLTQSEYRAEALDQSIKAVFGLGGVTGAVGVAARGLRTVIRALSTSIARGNTDALRFGDELMSGNITRPLASGQGASPAFDRLLNSGELVQVTSHRGNTYTGRSEGFVDIDGERFLRLPSDEDPNQLLRLRNLDLSTFQGQSPRAQILASAGDDVQVASIRGNVREGEILGIAVEERTGREIVQFRTSDGELQNLYLDQLDLSTLGPRGPPAPNARIVEEYVARGGDVVFAHYSDPSYRNFISESIGQIWNRSGIRPQNFDPTNPSHRQRLFDVWQEHIVPGIEDPNRGNYGNLRQQIINAAGGRASVGEIAARRAAVCRELSICGNGLFAEYGLQARVVSGTVTFPRGGGGGHAWVEILDTVSGEVIGIVDSNLTGSFHRNYDEYRAAFGGSFTGGFNYTTIAVPN